RDLDEQEVRLRRRERQAALGQLARHERALLEDEPACPLAVLGIAHRGERGGLAEAIDVVRRPYPVQAVDRLQATDRVADAQARQRGDLGERPEDEKTWMGGQQLDAARLVWNEATVTGRTVTLV